MENKDIKVCLGVTGYKVITTRTAESLLWLMKYSIYDLIFPGIKDSCYIVHNRSELVNAALQNNADYLLFVDGDMKFQPEILEQLMKHDKDIVGAAYNYRRLPLESTAKFPRETEDEMPDKLFKVDALGTGMMLIKMSAFEKIPKPWFSMKYDDNGRVEIGDDIWFCLQAQKGGIDIWCDPTIKTLKHLGDYEY